MQHQQRVESSESLQLPSPPAVLNSAKKKEYIELQRRIALHNLKKAEGASAKSSSHQGKQAVPTQGRKDTVTLKQPSRKHASSSQMATLRKGKARSFSEPCVMAVADRRGAGREISQSGKSMPGSVDVIVEENMSQQKSVEEKADKESCEASRKMADKEEREAVLKMADKEEREAVLKMAKKEERETGPKKEERKAGHSKLQETIKQHKRTVEKCHNDLTTFTNQLTDVVSEIEELELKILNLQKALGVSQSVLLYSNGGAGSMYLYLGSFAVMCCMLFLRLQKMITRRRS